jgi:hypothetical protein
VYFKPQWRAAFEEIDRSTACRSLYLRSIRTLEICKTWLEQTDFCTEASSWVLSWVEEYYASSAIGHQADMMLPFLSAPVQPRRRSPLHHPPRTALHTLTVHTAGCLLGSRSSPKSLRRVAHHVNFEASPALAKMRASLFNVDRDPPTFVATATIFVCAESPSAA